MGAAGDIVEDFIEDVWKVMTPEMVVRLKCVLTEDMGMSNKDADAFIELQRDIRRKRMFSKKSNRIVKLGLKNQWIKELSRDVADQMANLVVGTLLSNKTARTKTLTENILKHLCNVTGENTTIDSATTRVERTIVVVADRMASWIDETISSTEEKLKAQLKPCESIAEMSLTTLKSTETDSTELEIEDYYSRISDESLLVHETESPYIDQKNVDEEVNDYTELDKGKPKSKKEDKSETDDDVNDYTELDKGKPKSKKEDKSETDDDVNDYTELDKGKPKSKKEDKSETDDDVNDYMKLDKGKLKSKKVDKSETDDSKKELLVKKVKKEGKREKTDTKESDYEESDKGKTDSEEDNESETEDESEMEEESEKSDETENDDESEEDDDSEVVSQEESVATEDASSETSEEEVSEQKTTSDEDTKSDEQDTTDEETTSVEDKESEKEEDSEQESTTVNETTTEVSGIEEDDEETTDVESITNVEKESLEDISTTGAKEVKKLPQDVLDLLKEDVSSTPKGMQKSNRLSTVKEIIDQRFEKLAEEKLDKSLDSSAKYDIEKAASVVANWVDMILTSADNTPTLPERQGSAYEIKMTAGSQLEISKLSSTTVANKAAETRGIEYPIRKKKLPRTLSPINMNTSKDWADWALDTANIGEEWGKWIDSLIEDVESKLPSNLSPSDKTSRDKHNIWKQLQEEKGREAHKWLVEKQKIKQEARFWNKKFQGENIKTQEKQTKVFNY